MPDQDRLVSALKSGLGDEEARQRGFGALSVHPGKAQAICRPRPEELRVKANHGLAAALRRILEVRGAAERLPSPSQIRAVQQQLEKSGAEKALSYLDRQTKRTGRIWYTWEPIQSQVADLLQNCDPPAAAQALEVLVNLAIVDQKREERS
jgi:hypothetical protein